MIRCEWCTSHDNMIKYHDEEWGVPLHDDNKLFELLTLEGAQAGLSWQTILNKREAYRRAFSNFNIEAVAKYDEEDFERLINDSGIVRNKLKIRSTINNANAILRLRYEFKSFDEYIWKFVDYKPKINNFNSMKDMHSRNEISDNMSLDMLKRGFKFVGSTICYSFMQACGLTNDHINKCFRYNLLLP